MILLDSDVLIEFMRGREPARSFLEAAVSRGEELATTPLNVGEVLRGERDDTTRPRVTEFLTSLTELPIDGRVALEYAQLTRKLDRKGARMPEIDAFIAAAALVNGATLATGNAKHFERVPGLTVHDPRKSPG